MQKNGARRTYGQRAQVFGFSPVSLSPAVWIAPNQGTYSDGARQLTVASSQWLDVPSNASLQAGDIDFTLSCWLYLDATGSQPIICKRNTAGTDVEWMLWFSTGNFRWTVRNVANSLNTTHATTTGTYTSGTWYFVILEHNSVADTLTIRVNGTSETLSSYTGGIRAAANSLRVGGYSDDTVTTFGGRVDSLMITKRILSAAEKTNLYNAGGGRTYATVVNSVKDASLVSWWNMNELTGNAADAHGSNTLVASASSPTAVPGIVSALARNTEYVSLCTDLSGNGRNCGQSTLSKRPTFVSVFGSASGTLTDGVDDVLTQAPTLNLSGTTGYAAYAVVKTTNAALAQSACGHIDVGNNFRLGQNAAGAVEALVHGNAAGPFTATATPSTNLATAAGVISVRVNEGTQFITAGWNLVDGTPVAYTTGYNTNGTFSLRVGNHTTGAGNPWSGNIGEVLFFNRAVSATEHTSLVTYLKDKYGIA